MITQWGIILQARGLGSPLTKQVTSIFTFFKLSARWGLTQRDNYHGSWYGHCVKRLIKGLN